MLRFRLEVCAGLDAPLKEGVVRACFGGIPGRGCEQAVVGGVLVVSSVWLVFVPVTVSGGQFVYVCTMPPHLPYDGHLFSLCSACYYGNSFYRDFVY